MLKRTLKGLSLVAAFLLLSSCELHVFNGGSNNNNSKSDDIAPSSEKEITEFVLADVSGTIGDEDIAVVLPFGTSTSLKPTITVSDKATVSPGSLEEQDFSVPVIYTVTAEDGSTKGYIVTVTIGTLTCEEADLEFSAALGSANCDDVTLYLDAYIDGACVAGGQMDFIQMMMQLINSGVCNATCSERSALAYSYIATGNTMSAAQQINWLANFSDCYEECVEVTADYPGDPGGLVPCKKPEPAK